MRLGLIARADNRGLGNQTWEAYRHLAPAKTMVVDCPSKAPLPLHLERFPDATVVHGLPTARDFRHWLQDLDVVLTAETAYNNELYAIARRMNVRVVVQLNYEFFDRNATPDLWAAPSMWHWDDIPDRKVHLPVPIALDRFPERPARDRAAHFLHIVGRPAIHDRNGTADLLAALPFVQSEVRVTIRCQDPRYVPSLLQRRTVPSNVELVIESSDTVNYWENYDADVLMMPRRFGGLCLPCNEALGAGMPVIMPDISPNTWLPAEWLVPATQEGRFMARTMIDLYTVDHVELAARIDQFATDETFFAQAQDTARQMAKELSWDAMLPVYEQTFADLLS